MPPPPVRTHHPAMVDASSPAGPRVVIAGAGVAGIEAALALREFTGGRASVTTIDPGQRFAIPASATGSAFGIPPSVDLPLARVVSRAGAALRRSHLVAVDGRRRLAMLAGGELLRYDRLVVAVGPRTRVSIPAALTFRGHADVEELRGLIGGVVAHAERGGDTDLVVVIPTGCGWPLAGYEIALMTREHLVAAGHGDATRVAVVTAESVPLAMFGPLAGGAVVRKLRRMDIEIVTGAEVDALDWGRLTLSDGSTRPVDRVIALPAAQGPALAGLPCDQDGFIICAEDGTVADAPGVHVIGDAGAFPVKRGGIACQQADSVASGIARDLGLEVEELPFMPAMPEWVWDGTDGWLLKERSLAEESGDVTRWWPVPKMSGRFLAPFLHELAQLPVPAHVAGA
jgi:sulfide:quinone oxidoreductase